MVLVKISLDESNIIQLLPCDKLIKLFLTRIYLNIYVNQFSVQAVFTESSKWSYSRILSCIFYTRFLPNIKHKPPAIFKKLIYFLQYTPCKMSSKSRLAGLHFLEGRPGPARRKSCRIVLNREQIAVGAKRQGR